MKFIFMWKSFTCAVFSDWKIKLQHATKTIFQKKIIERNYWTTNQSAERVSQSLWIEHWCDTETTILMAPANRQTHLIASIHLFQHEKRFSKNIKAFRSHSLSLGCDIQTFFNRSTVDDNAVTGDESKLISKEREETRKFQFLLLFCRFEDDLFASHFLVIRHEFHWIFSLLECFEKIFFKRILKIWMMWLNPIPTTSSR